MNKVLLHNNILTELKKIHQYSIDAAQRAYETAVDEENEAENKYDTMGLEASYLAHGQSQRVEECMTDINGFEHLKVIHFSSEMPINIGALVQLKNEEGETQVLFMSPVAGGLRILFEEREITLITTSSPIGKALLSSYVGDEVIIHIADDKKYYEIISIE